MSREEFRKKYPHLSKEIEGSEPVDLKQDEEDMEAPDSEEEPSQEEEIEGEPEEQKVQDEMVYDPGVNDFLARCETDQQALEIINYLEKRGEITKDQAESLRRRLKAKGVRSFGDKKAGRYRKTSIK
jgi:hypothetical protein